MTLPSVTTLFISCLFVLQGFAAPQNGLQSLDSSIGELNAADGKFDNAHTDIVSSTPGGAAFKKIAEDLVKRGESEEETIGNWIKEMLAEYPDAQLDESVVNADLINYVQAIKQEQAGSKTRRKM